MKMDVELLASYWTIAGSALPHTDREYGRAFARRGSVGEATASRGDRPAGLGLERSAEGSRSPQVERLPVLAFRLAFRVRLGENLLGNVKR